MRPVGSRTLSNRGLGPMPQSTPREKAIIMRSITLYMMRKPDVPWVRYRFLEAWVACQEELLCTQIRVVVAVYPVAYGNASVP